MLFHHGFDERLFVVREVVFQQFAALQQGCEEDGASCGGVGRRGLGNERFSQTIQNLRLRNIAGAALQYPADLGRGTSGGDQTASQRLKKLCARSGPANDVLLCQFVEHDGRSFGYVLVEGGEDGKALRAIRQ